MEVTPKNGVTNLADHRKAKAKQLSPQRRPRKKGSRININVTTDGKLSFASSNLTRRNAFKLLLGLYITAGEVFQLLSTRRP